MSKNIVSTRMGEYSADRKQVWWVNIEHTEGGYQWLSITRPIISDWLRNTLGWDDDRISKNIYSWGVTFDDEADALLCHMAFK